MAKLVVLTAIAEADLEKVTDYLVDNWGSSICETFLLRFEQVCATISDSPDIYPMIYKKEKIRKCVLTRQNTMYFRELPNKIEIITIFDTRQDPDKLSEIIKKPRD